MKNSGVNVASNTLYLCWDDGKIELDETTSDTGRVAMIFDREYRTINKAEWGSGEWQNEPDKAQWVDPATGLDCLLVRNMGGALCGYVGVPPEHPWHGMEYNECFDENCVKEYCHDPSPERVTQVHGGLTFASACSSSPNEAEHVCHVPLDGRPHDVWWFGFDCGHFQDYMPVYGKGRAGDTVYRNVGFVVDECSRLAVQLAEVS